MTTPDGQVARVAAGALQRTVARDAHARLAGRRLGADQLLAGEPGPLLPRHARLQHGRPLGRAGGWAGVPARPLPPPGAGVAA